MRIKKAFDTDTKVTLTITTDEAFLTRLKDVTLKRLAHDVKLSGFRPGKAPLALVEKNIDPSRLQSDVLDAAVNHLYSEALRAEKLRPVANPELSLKKFVPFTELEFTATVEVIGEIKLPDYKKMKKILPKVTITTEDIKGVMATLQKRLAEKSEVSRAAKTGDEVVMDFKGTDSKGQPVSGADAEKYPLIIGSDAFIPGFEPELVGLKANEEKTFTVTFPKDYQVKTLAGQKITFSIKIHSVSELKEPKVDDAFAAKAGPFKTVQDLKDDIKRQLTFEQETEARKTFNNDLIQEIAAKTKIAIPEMLIDDQVLRAEDEERQNLMYRGQTWQEHLEGEGVTDEEHRTRQRPAAEATIKGSLILSEIAEQEGVTVTPEEVEIRMQLLRGQYTDPAMRAELDKPENRRDIEGRLLSEKTLQKLTDYVTKN